MRKVFSGMLAASLFLGACSSPSAPKDTFISAFAHGDPVNITANGDRTTPLQRLYAGEAVQVFCALNAEYLAVRMGTDTGVDLWTNIEDIPLGIVAEYAILTTDPLVKIPTCSTSPNGNVHGPEAHKGH